MSTADIEIVLNDVSRYGLQRLHLTSTQPIDLLEQTQRFVGEGKIETWLAYEDADPRLHHLRIYWRSMKDGQPVRGTEPSLLEKYATNGGSTNVSK